MRCNIFTSNHQEEKLLLTPNDFTILTAFAEVQHTSFLLLHLQTYLRMKQQVLLDIFLSTILHLFLLLMTIDTSCINIWQQNLLFGLINFAVSAMKCTPAIIIISAEVFDASTARARESAEKSAIP